MTLIAGHTLALSNFFMKSGNSPKARGSSFDLTIGLIFDHEGKRVYEPFALKPGRMIQVISAEIFDLPNNVTGHVTYKTDLTKKGIWALTVGIVDPGWRGPISTTLLNFSRVDYCVVPGEAFLRVSMFEHEAVSHNKLPASIPVSQYWNDVEKVAKVQFSPSFLNSDEIAKKAGDKVLNRIRKEALVWVTVIALFFAVLQIAGVVASRIFAPVQETSIRDAATDSLTQIEQLQRRVDQLERKSTDTESHLPTQ